MLLLGVLLLTLFHKPVKHQKHAIIVHAPGSRRNHSLSEELGAAKAVKGTVKDAPAALKEGRTPSCGGCLGRESVLSETMHLNTYQQVLRAVAPFNSIIVALLLVLCMCIRRFMQREQIITLFFSLLYLITSPTAILVNKMLMKDFGFGYPIVVSALGQFTTMVCATVMVRAGVEEVEAGSRVSCATLALLGGASALTLILGQYPYLYLTVAFIQMLKAFSPTYMVIFLLCLGIETPSPRVIASVLGLSLCTAIASVGEVNFNIIGVLFMAAASCSDALRLVLAQKLLKNNKLKPIETMYYTSPICLLWMAPVALFSEARRAQEGE